jgi:hypothetical protein
VENIAHVSIVKMDAQTKEERKRSKKESQKASSEQVMIQTIFPILSKKKIANTR